MKATLWLIPVYLFAQVAPRDPAPKNWINQNSATGGVTHITVRNDDGRTIVRRP